MSTTWPNELEVSNSWALIHDPRQMRRFGVPSAGSDQVYTKDTLKIMM